MALITHRAYPRAALIGNPSDGYRGRTMAFVFSNYHAQVTLRPADQLEIIPGERNRLLFDHIEALTSDIAQHGYYGGIRLIKAAINRFAAFCRQQQMELPATGFSVSHHSTIPNRLGMAGSSAIITAALKALMTFFDVPISKYVLSHLAWEAETKELGIPAGLQDRVAQAFETLVYMDFSADEKHDGVVTGHYEMANTGFLPPLFIAFRPAAGEGSEVTHSGLREKYDRHDCQTLQAIEEWKSLTDQFLLAMEGGHVEELKKLMNRNFDLRRQVCNIHPAHLELVELARSAGFCAKFTGSGGAIIGICETDEQFHHLEKTLQPHGIEVIRPRVVG